MESTRLSGPLGCTRHRNRWLPGLAWVGSLLLFGTAGRVQGQAPFAITNLQVEANGRVALQAPAAPGSYSVLYRGDGLRSIRKPVAMEPAPAAGGPSAVTLIDPPALPRRPAAFYRVEQVPVSSPQDADGDGLDDIYELQWRPWVDPLNPEDPHLDPDEDHRSTRDELRAGTNPFQFTTNPAPLVEYPMPTVNTPFDPQPTNAAQSLVQRVLMYASDLDGNAIPVKTIRIRNNAAFTVFPVMRDANEAETGGTNSVGLYDPYDPTQTEYRGYVGYQGGDGRYYFGLRSGQEITIRVPLVFWNGARMGILTDGRYLTPAAGLPNPLYYDPNAQRVVAPAERPASAGGGPGNPQTDGVVMWYRTAKLAPALDSPDQLLEWTIRDGPYLGNPQITARTGGLIPDSEKVTLINYDVSYVDNMFLPVAMEALDVPVPAPPVPFTQNRGPYGWIGATNTTANLQGKIRAFTAGDSGMLGTYFGTNGWPFYNVPPDPQGELKIPAGQNIFAQSPLAGANSTYDLQNNRFMLSSGGNGPIKVTIGGEGLASSGNVLSLTPNVDVALVQTLTPGFTVVGYPPAGASNPITPGTKITRILHVSTGPGDVSRVELDQPLIASQNGCTFDFFRPVTDYASEAMIRLWFSWASHYLALTQNTPSQTVVGAVATNEATLRFAAPVTGLVEGMQVTGPGLDNPNPAQEKGGVTILSIASDQRSVILSQLSREAHSLAEGRTYTFLKPQPLPATPTGLYTLDFTADPMEPARLPSEFAKKVYQIMAAMAQIPKNPDPTTKTPHVLDLMNNVIGGNMGFIFDTNDRRFSTDGLGISATIRDMIKSVLRGVTDFTQFGERASDGSLVWYPDPAVPQGGLTFNAYNLDPFVWFVHVKLGFSGYGFSLDDDTADVGAGEATQMMVTVGGINGLPNTNQWTIQAVYGPVSGEGDWDPAQTVSFYEGITAATQTSPIVISSIKHGLRNGERVTLDQVEGNTAANGTWTVANVTTDTFELVGSTGDGAYTSGGRWTRGSLPYISGVDALNIYWRLKGDDRQAGFTGALVTGPGVQQRGAIRIQQLGDNLLAVLALNAPLTNADGTPLPKGRYRWTFSGN
jgi:hypothetical protein